MSVSHRYQDFGAFRTSSELRPNLDQEALEDQKLQSFETGYKAGWDDAILAQADDELRVSAELAQNLQQMSFTYHEAMAKLTSGLQPLLAGIVEKMLPAAGQSALGGHVLEQLGNLLKQQMEQPIEIVVSDQNAPAIRALLEDKLDYPFELVIEPSLGAGQAFVRVGETERRIDLDAVVEGISKAIEAFFHAESKE